MEEIRTKKIEEVTQRLMQNLDEMITAYRQLLEVVRNEKNCFSENNVEKLNESNEIKENLLVKIKALDSIRERYALELGQLVQIESSAPRLLELAQKVPFEWGEKLRLNHATLDLIIRRLQVLNQQNHKIVETSLQVLHGALSDLKESLSPAKTYGRDKKMGSISEGAGVLRHQKA